MRITGVPLHPAKAADAGHFSRLASDRIVRAAIRAHDGRLYAGIQGRLTLATRDRLEALMQPLRTVIRNSSKGHYRRMVSPILRTLKFRSDNRRHRPLIQALDFLKRYADSKPHTIPAEEDERPGGRPYFQAARGSALFSSF